MASDRPILETVRLSVRREGRPLLDAISMKVARGSIHAVVGPNGAGKSTLLSALLGQTQFAGKVVCHFEKSGAVGFVPQSLATDRTLPVTALELLALSRQKRPICFGVGAAVRERCEALLERVGLAGLGARRIGALSGGELQRVLFANAIDPVPELLLLDEPASGLDQSSVARLEAILRELRNDSGTTALLVSHDIRQVRRIADAVTYIDRTVRNEGTVAEVLGDGPFFPFVEGGT